MTEKIIRISAGHGPGKNYNRGFIKGNEGDFNFLMGNLFVDHMAANYKVNISEIRRQKGNYDHSLKARAAYGSGADMFLSWHSNAANGKASGVEILLSYQSLKDIRLAENICATISKTLNIPNRGVKFRNYNTGKFETKSTATASKKNWYGELRGNKARVAMLMEVCFHDNINDNRKYQRNKTTLVKNIARVVANYFNIDEKMKSTPEIKVPINKNPDQLYRVQVGAYKNKENAVKLEKELRSKKYDTFILKAESGLYKVQVGAYKNKENAEETLKKLEAEGYKPFITIYNQPKETQTFALNEKVQIVGTHYSTGQRIPNWARKQTHTIQQIGTGKVLLKELYSWVNIKDIKAV